MAEPNPPAGLLDVLVATLLAIAPGIVALFRGKGARDRIHKTNTLAQGAVGRVAVLDVQVTKLEERVDRVEEHIDKRLDRIEDHLKQINTHLLDGQR